MLDEAAEQWGACWDVHGVRSEDGMAVRVRVGVVELDGRDVAAVAIAGESPIALTDTDAAQAAELFEWAVEEREMLADLREQRETENAKELLDRAILTRAQWVSIRRILERQDNEPQAMNGALQKLRSAAPASWRSCDE